MRSNQSIIFGNKDTNPEGPTNDESGLILFNSKSDTYAKLNESYKKEKKKKKAIKDYLKVLKDIEFIVNTKHITHAKKIYDWQILLGNSTVELRKLKQSLKKCDRKETIVNFIIQVLESDKEIRRTGEIMEKSILLTQDVAKPWIEEVLKGIHDVEIAKLKAQLEEENKPFVEGSILDPTIIPNAIIGTIAKGVTFIGSILKSNRDDVIFTAIGSAKPSNKLIEIMEEGIVKIKLKISSTKDEFKPQKDIKNADKAYLSFAITG